MHKPKINLFNWFSAIGTLVTLVSGLLPFSIWPLPWKLCIAAICLIASLCYSFYDYRRQSLQFFYSYNELHQRHQAIAAQFDQKNKVLDDYENAFSEFENFITVALVQPSKTESHVLETIYRIFLSQKRKINGESYNG